MKTRTLNVKIVTAAEIYTNWEVSFPTKQVQCFARCNAKGEINWDKTHIYNKNQLAVRKNINIVNDATGALAKIIALSGNIKGIYKVVYNRAPDMYQFCFDVAQQANTGKQTRIGTENTVGKEIVKLCLQIYPNVKLGDTYKKLKSEPRACVPS